LSLKPRPIDPIPAETARVAYAAFPKGNPYLCLRDDIGTIFEDQDFADLFSVRGQPALSPWRLALITVLQFREGLSDRLAAEAVRSRIDWKYLLGLELSDPGFDFSVLCEFRKRLIAREAASVLLDKLLKVCQASGFIKARGQQRSDSTRVLASIRELTRLEQIGESLRAALNRMAGIAPAWLQSVIPAEWYSHYRYRIENERFPKAKAQRREAARQMGADCFLLLDLVTGANVPDQLAALPEIAHLRQIVERHFIGSETGPDLRSEKELAKLPPAAESPYDPEARFRSRHGITWFGYFVHLTESCDDDSPHLIMHITTTPATTHEAQVTAQIHKALIDKGFPPGTHLVDSAYVSGELLVHSAREYDITLLGPPRRDPSWQVSTPGAYDQYQFQIDWDKHEAICPQGKVSKTWHRRTRPAGAPYIKVGFAKKDCLPCPAKALCTRSTSYGRQLSIPERASYEALKDIRQQFAQGDVYTLYNRREGIEGTISQGTRAFGLRQARYRGLAKTHLQFLATAAAMNVDRLFAWMSGVPRATSRVSRLAALVSV